MSDKDNFTSGVIPHKEVLMNATVLPFEGLLLLTILVLLVRMRLDFPRRLKAIWVKALRPSNRGNLFLAMAFVWLNPNLQEDDPVRAAILRFLGLGAILAIVGLFLAALFGERKVAMYAEKGIPGAGAINWLVAFGALLIVVTITGILIGATDLFNSWPARGIESAGKLLCGSLCD